MDSKVINHAIQKALGEDEQLGIKGKEVTHFLLKKIVELTGGDSLESNIHLFINNAIVGAEISKEYALLK